MDTELLYELVEWIKEISPELWKIGIRQVYVQVFGSALWLLAGIVFGFMLHDLAQHCDSKIAAVDDPDDAEGWLIARPFAWVGIGICIIIALTALYYVVGPLLNVEYYAIKALLDLIPMPN